ncbi:CHAT domain-containing tetratricopeptide repeat protein [Flammeovirga sp. SubArs3]|uniref:CHAT domain-containing protein n=1 Tax=Flammeovirga sp. SubArs3 TaxID=2995316 RepID=UPI00248CE0F0|nr:CHAT domain-containing tetratricopeptide repeat protein [Flammeovirga sp. SubArs3]
MIKYIFCFLLVFNLFATPNASAVNEIPLTYEEITPDTIKLLQEQGKLVEAKELVNRWLKVTESEYGDESIEIVIPLLIASELSIIHYEYKDAIKHLEKSIAVMDKSSGWLYPDYAMALNYLAYCKVSIGDSFAAFPLINEAEMIYYKTLTREYPGYNLCNINRAILNRELGEFQKSEDYFKKSIEFIESREDIISHSKVDNVITMEWLNIQFAKLYTDWYKPEKALPLLQSAQKSLIEKDRKNSPIYSTLLQALAEHCYISNDYKMSFSFYEQLIDHRRQHFGETHLATMRAYLGLGKLMADTGYLDKALKYYGLVDKTVSKLKGYNNLKADLYLSIADVYLQKGKPLEIEDYLEKVEIEKTTVRDLYFFHLKVLGDYYFLKGDYINSELKLMELISLVRQEKVFYTKYYSEAITTLTDLFVTLGRIQNAIGLCDSEIRFLKKRGMEVSIVYLDLKLTLLNAQLIENMINEEQTMENIASIEDSLTRFINPNHPLFIKSNTLKGAISKRKKEYNAAASYFHLAIDVANRHGIDEMQYQRIKIIDQAGAMFIEKNELSSALDEFRVLKGKFSEESVYWPGFLGRVAYVKALLGEWEEARMLAIKGVDMRFDQYDTQLNFKSEDEKINYIHHTSGIFNYFFSLMIKSEGFKSPLMVEKCYDLQLNYRKYFLKEAELRKRKIEQLGKYRSKMNFPYYYEELDKQKSKLATANFFSIKERNDLHIDTYMLTDRINNLEKSIGFAAKANKDSLDVEGYLSWKDVQAKLEENEVAVEIIKLKSINPTEEFYVAIAVSSDCKTPKFIPIGNAKIMENDLFRAYNKETAPRTRSLVYKKKSEKTVNAYDFYWKPIQKGLNELSPTIDKIYLSKDGIYNAINLNVLHNKETDKFLIEEKDIQLVISTSEINKSEYLNNLKNNEICLFGNPIFEGEVSEQATRQVEESSADQEKYSFFLPNLPGTKTELENTEKLFKSKDWKVNTYYQARATEGNIKKLSSSPAIMHIATHGIYMDEMINPILENQLLKSGLFFTEVNSNQEKSLEDIYASGNDGILTAYEVKGLNLKNTSLLILSACQSGVSDISDGDGISGLQYAFSIAGVKSIIMSLWSVDDIATQKLMNEFYNQWFLTNDIDKAFRNAQLQLMKEYKDPYYWGAFVLVH